MKQELKKGIVSILVHNNPHTLMKISGLCARKGFNIRNISLGRTNRQGLSQITVVLESNNGAVDKIQKQLYKVFQTVNVSPVKPENNITKELAFIKVNISKIGKSELINLVEQFEGKIIESNESCLIIELTGCSEKIDSFVNAVGKNNVIDLVSSGIVAIDRIKNRKKEE